MIAVNVVNLWAHYLVRLCLISARLFKTSHVIVVTLTLSVSYASL